MEHRLELNRVRSWNEHIQAELAALATQGRLRRLRSTEGKQGVTLVIDGHPVINFSSNDYLGLAGSALLQQAVVEGVTRWGTGAGASRLIAGNLGIHEELEQTLAAWKATEEALLFSSGYQANVGILSALLGPGDLVLSDALNHASIIDGCRLSGARILVYRHLDLDHLEALLRQESPRHRRTLVVSDSVFSMDGDQVDVRSWAALAARYGAMTLLDEAHATGVLGPRGAGLGSGHAVDLQLGTLGKALGVSGAYVCASRQLIQYLVNRCRTFIFTTAPSPATSAAALAAVRYVASPAGEQRRQKLLGHTAALQRGAAALGLSIPRGHIVPLRVRDGSDQRAMNLTQRLLERGIYLQGIRPPTIPEGTARLRLTLMATHTEQHLDQVLQALAELRDELE